MQLAHELLSQLESLLGPHRPKVARLHLPPMPWNAAKDGEFGALELDDGSLGLGYVLLGNTLAALGMQPGAALKGADALALARRWCTGVEPGDRALGLAAVNALSRHLMDRIGFRPPPATDSLAGLALQAGEHIGMVGLFPPLLRQVTACGARLTVLELRPGLAGEQAGYRVTLDPRELHACHKVLATSTTLMNHTLQAVLAQCTSARAVALIGPSAGCLPGLLFAQGLTAVGGSWVHERAGFADALARGEPWSAYAAKFTLTPDTWATAAAALKRRPNAAAR